MLVTWLLANTLDKVVISIVSLTSVLLLWQLLESRYIIFVDSMHVSECMMRSKSIPLHALASVESLRPSALESDNTI